jgi:DNA-binding beta-propeller fold protein YncE
MKGTPMYLALSIVTAVCQFGLATAASAQASTLRVTSEQTVGGFAFPESVAYDPNAKALYASEFVSKLDPVLKDGKGRISKVSLAGKVLEQQFLPAAGGEPLNKPKGIWVSGNRLWVTDIDVVWLFDLKTKRGRKAALPGVTFANDPAVADNVLYVSDNRSDRLVRVEPADFLNAKGDPKVTTVFAGAGVHPNGLYPARDGMLRIVGFLAPDKPRPIFALGVGGQLKTLSDPIGRLDGVYELRDGGLLVTDWNSGSLFAWSERAGMTKLATGFKGPADFSVVPSANGLTVVVPDLVQSELRFIQLAR